MSRPRRGAPSARVCCNVLYALDTAQAGAGSIERAATDEFQYSAYCNYCDFLNCLATGFFAKSSVMVWDCQYCPVAPSILSTSNSLFSQPATAVERGPQPKYTTSCDVCRLHVLWRRSPSKKQNTKELASARWSQSTAPQLGVRGSNSNAHGRFVYFALHRQLPETDAHVASLGRVGMFVGRLFRCTPTTRLPCISSRFRNTTLTIINGAVAVLSVF